MKKTVYHGSDHIIERPKYGYGKIYNDYGVGFYCTENQNMAKEWGVSAVKMVTQIDMRLNVMD